MPTVIYRLADSSERRIEVPAGTSAMQAAVQNDVEGIVAECGGSCACATCHVYVDEAFLARLPPASELESELLTVTAAERRPNSRLSCQLIVTPELDGLAVTIPETQ
jgi:ferredoxin, 2Fe-2S